MTAPSWHRRLVPPASKAAKARRTSAKIDRVRGRPPCGERCFRPACRCTSQGRDRIRDRAHLLDPSVAMEDDIAAGGQRRTRALRERARQCPHGNVIAHQQAFESDRIAKSRSCTIVTEVVAGATGS